MGDVRSINSRQILAMFVVAVGYIHLGSVITFPTLLTTDKKSILSNIYGEEMPLTAYQMDHLSSIMSVGSLAGCLTISFIISRYGKRPTMCINGIAGGIAWLGIAFSPNIATLQAFRVLCGTTIGIVSVAGTNYITEIVEPKYRGAFISILDCFIVFGNFTTCAMGYWLTYYEIAFVNAVFPVIVTAGFFFLPESPTFFVMKGKMKEARAVLLQIRNEGANIDEELKIFHDINTEQAKDKNVWEGLMMPKTITRIVVVLSLYFIRCFAGYEVIVANPSRMFAVYEGINAKMASIAMTVVQIVSVLVFSLFIIDTLGRKKCMILSVLVTALGLLSLSAFHFYNQMQARNKMNLHKLYLLKDDLEQSINYNGYSEFLQQNETSSYKLIHDFDALEGSLKQSDRNNSHFLFTNNASNSSLIAKSDNYKTSHESLNDKIQKYLPLASFMFVIVGFSLGLSIIPFIVTSEYFPTWLRAEASCICVAGFTIFQFSSLLSYTAMLNAFTPAGFFLFCSILCILATPLALFCMPETMGKVVA